MQRHYISNLQVRNNCIVIYDRPAQELAWVRNIEGFAKAYSGQVQTGTQKRIRKAIDILLQTNPERTIWNPVSQCHHPYRLGFMTLTVADQRNISAREGYQKLLKEFLRWVSRKGVTDYIWKAELQSRGQLHYHLTINQFIHYQEIQKAWNGLQRRAGLLDAYAKREGHFNPNSTDIHSVRNIKDFDAYLSKYIAKAEQNQEKLNGKVWDCSSSLKKDRFSVELDSLSDLMIRRGIEAKKLAKIPLEQCTIIRGKNFQSYLSPATRAAYASWLRGVQNATA